MIKKGIKRLVQVMEFGIVLLVEPDLALTRLRRQPTGETKKPNGNKAGATEKVAACRSDVARRVHWLTPRDITVAVPVYNAFEETRECICALLEHTSEHTPLLIINDGSTDERIPVLLDEVSSANPRLTVVHNDGNLGYTATVNRACTLTTGDVVLLNSDTVVSEGWLDKLWQAAHSRPRVATVTPVSNAAGVFSVPQRGKLNPFPDGVACGAAAHLLEAVSERHLAEAPTGNGFCLYITRAALDQVGLFDSESFPRGYGEENDFCMRARKKGFVNLVDEGTFIYHKRSASFGDGKRPLAVAGTERLRQLHPDYLPAVESWLKADPHLYLREPYDRSLRLAARYHRRRKGSLDTILYVIHADAGGAPMTTCDLAGAAARAGHRTIVLRTAPQRWELHGIEADGTQTALWQRSFASSRSSHLPLGHERAMALCDVLEAHPVDLAHVRHLLGNAPEVVHYLSGLGIPIVFSFHDYYAACPAIHLINNRGVYCAGRCNSDLEDCHVNRKWLRDLPYLKSDYIFEWRARLARALSLCDAYVTTAASAKALLCESYQFLSTRDFRIIPHGRDLRGFVDVAVAPSKRRPIRVVAFGAFNAKKGAHLLQSVLLENQKVGRPFELHVLGTKDECLDPDRFSGVYHGPYSVEDLPGRLRDIGPSFAILPSVMPETFCHTLTEAWASGLPVFAYPLGALQDRIKTHGGGWLVDSRDPKAWLRAMLAVSESRDAYESSRREIAAMAHRDVSDMWTDYLDLYSSVLQLRANGGRAS